MTGELRRGLLLAALFAAGIAAGIWIFVSPWALGYPTPAGWTASVWTSIWVGGLLTAASAVSLLVVLARSVHVALLSRPEGE